MKLFKPKEKEQICNVPNLVTGKKLLTLGILPENWNDGTLRQDRWKGGPDTIPFIKKGGRVYYDVNKVVQKLNSLTRTSTSDPGDANNE